MNKQGHRFVRLICFFLMCIAPSLCGGDDGYPRQTLVDVQHYDFWVALDDGSDKITVESTITLKILGPMLDEIFLDLVGHDAQGRGMVVSQVLMNGQACAFSHRGERLKIASRLHGFENKNVELKVVYEGIPKDGLIISPNKYGERTFFADNWPNRARHWLAVIDHPYDKASCRFAVEAPAHYQVVAVGDLLEERDLDGQRRLTVFAEPAPLPTKVMVIGVGHFAVQHLPSQGAIEIQSWVYPQDRQDGYTAFCVVPKILGFYEQQIGPFSFAKMVSVQSKTRFGGMENAGAIFYNENAVAKKGGIESLIAHEMAHQWFGDSVSEADWQHVWLSEGFATYLTAVYNAQGAKRSLLADSMAMAREHILEYALEKPQGSVLDKQVGMDELLSTLTYQKGAWVLHMLCQQLGEEIFWRGIKTFYERYRERNALTADFIAIMEGVSGQELGWFFAQWLDGPGFPVLKTTWRNGSAHKPLVLTLKQVQPWSGYFTFDLMLDLYQKGHAKPVPQVVHMTRRQQSFQLNVSGQVERIEFDPQTKLLFAEPKWLNLYNKRFIKDK